MFFETPFPSPPLTYLRVWMTGPRPSEGLDLPLQFAHAVRQFIKNLLTKCVCVQLQFC